MRTSRLSQDAAKVAALTSAATRRQTRSQAANSSPLATTKTTKPKSGARKFKGRQTKTEEDEAAGSPPLSPSPDIEDLPFTPASNRKRKRGAGASPPSATLKATASAAKVTRTSPRKIKSEQETESYELDERLNDRTRLPKARPQAAKKVVDPDTGEVTIHAPPNWEKMYDMVKEMRKRLVAPVDTMGCERAADVKLSPKDQRFQTLIALMLSSQTKDTTNFAVMQKLRKELPSPGLTLTNILALTDTPEVLNQLIWAVGFHNNKTRYILQTAAILRDRYGGDIPPTAEELMTLPGVGPKMAYLVMSAAWDKTEGIGVDVHVHRITNLWGWNKTREPEQTRKELESWLPRDKWREINWLLVGLGQTVCTPVGRKCGGCDLAGKGLCAGEVVDRKVRVVKKDERVKIEEVDRLVGGETDVVVKEETVGGRTDEGVKNVLAKVQES